MKTITEKITYAAGFDAGDKSMRQAGRTKWNREDYDIASQELLRMQLTGGFITIEQALMLGYVEPTTHVFVRFPSHRARTNALRILEQNNFPKPEAYRYQDIMRESGHGIYKVSAEAFKCLTDHKRKTMQFTIARNPELLGKCY